jgi:hypothetical protein
LSCPTGLASIPIRDEVFSDQVLVCWLDYSTPRPLRTQWHLGRLLQRIVMPKARADIQRKKCMGAPTFHHPPAKVTRLGSSRVDFLHGSTGHNFYGSQLHLGNPLVGRCRVPLHTSPDANISTRDLKPASPTSSLRIFSRDTFSFVPACETGVETCIISNLVLYPGVVYRTIVGDAERLVWPRGKLLAVTDKTLGDAAPNLALLLVCISLSACFEDPA